MHFVKNFRVWDSKKGARGKTCLIAVQGLPAIAPYDLLIAQTPIPTARRSPMRFIKKRLAWLK